ncbi:MAG: UvrD-helicase domain-containing protein, partial [Christensenellaceae bacterium]
MDRYEYYLSVLNPKRNADRQFFLDLLDTQVQKRAETERVKATMEMLRIRYINGYKKRIRECREQIEAVNASGEFTAENVQKIERLRAQIAKWTAEIDKYRCFFEEPYFARMDLTDPVEGYNAYYIGKKGDVSLEIVDWRAPVAKKYYQKSQISFSINEYSYKTILRRALSTKNGEFLDYQNEYLSVRDYLSAEEIAGRDEEILFDPYLKQIIRERKEETDIRDIIRTIQERQYEIITRPERENLVVQGCAGSGKTMILLHRLSYLLYNNEKLQTRDVLVLTPSDSFNSFIDELAKVLELQSVKTMTIEEYFAMLLKGKGIEFTEKISQEREPREYLAYLYSDRFVSDARRTIDRMYENVRGLFASQEVEEFVGEIRSRCKRQDEAYGFLKNASVRVRRAVLGEIKEKPDGGLHYTKPFREFMHYVQTIGEFFSLDMHSEEMRNDSYLTKQLSAFFQGAAFVFCNYEKICRKALEDLHTLKNVVEKEIADLYRYKYRTDGEEILTYADRIERRTELLVEADKAAEKVTAIMEDSEPFADFYQVICGEKHLVRIASCTSELELSRFFYREIVKKAKKKYGVEGMVRSDYFAIAAILTYLGVSLYPHYGFVFIDEGQDISPAEYGLIRTHNPTAAINVFGDLEQNVTDYRGIASWSDALDVEPYRLDQNYRNVNQIVDYVSSRLGIRMTSIGFDGDEIEFIGVKGIRSFFADRKGLKAVIVSESAREKYNRKGYHSIGE